MGSPLAPVLPNFIMGHKKLWLDNYTGSRVLYCSRYVDDIICCSGNSEDAIMCFNTLTCTILTSSSQWKHLPFLDVQVSLSKQSTSHNQCSCVTSVFLEEDLHWFTN